MATDDRVPDVSEADEPEIEAERYSLVCPRKAMQHSLHSAVDGPAVWCCRCGLTFVHYSEARVDTCHAIGRMRADHIVTCGTPTDRALARRPIGQEIERHRRICYVPHEHHFGKSGRCISCRAPRDLPEACAAGLHEWARVATDGRGAETCLHCGDWRGMDER